MDSYYERFCETVAMALPGRVINLDVAGLEHEADDEKEERARYETEVESEVNGYEETALGVLLPILSDAVLSVTGPSDQELNSVPQALGNVSSEIAKQSLPHAKKLKGTVKPSIGGRLNEFFSLDKDRDAQTRSPTNEVFLKNEYGKEKTDQEIDDAAVTNLKKHQTLSGRPVKWPQQPAFVVIRFLPLYSQNTSIQYLVLYNVCIELFYF